jgi:transaldolase
MTNSPLRGVKVFADGADLSTIASLAQNPDIKGFTTNPSLMRKAGVREYETFARRVLEIVPDRPISFEVFSDDFEDMYRQAVKVASWGRNVYVKIPVTNTKRETATPLLRRLVADEVQVNVTALMTLRQVAEVTAALEGTASAFISVFAGRIADTGRDPLPLMSASLALMAANDKLELIWASPREVLNVVQAGQIGCHVITVTADLLAKIKGFGKDLDQFSLETVRMFYDDASQAGFTL